MKFSFGYDEADERCPRLKGVMLRQVSALIQRQVSVFYTGMAQGVDQWGAEIVLALKRQYPHIRLAAVLPCETQANKWSAEQRERYFSTLAKCDDTILLNSRYTPRCMLERNRYMVDHAGSLLAVYGGAARGGTACIVRYAREKKREILIIHPDTPEVLSGTDLEAPERRRHLQILFGKKR